MNRETLYREIADRFDKLAELESSRPPTPPDDDPIPTPEPEPKPVPTRSLGMDAGRPTFWSPCPTFADAFRCCDIAAGDELLKADWARRGCKFEDGGFIFPLFTILPVVDGSQPFTLEIDGDVSVRFRDSIGQQRYKGPGTFQVLFPAAIEEGVVIFSDVEPGDACRLWYPGEQGNLFHSAYTAALASMSTIRGLDWLSTNGISYVGNLTSEWSDAAQAQTWGQATKDRGAAHAYLRKLGEICQADLWVNIPVRATDDYIERMTEVYRGYPHEIIFEYSNENWNFAQPFRYQRAYCLEQAIAHGITGVYDWEQVMRWQVRRTIEAARIIRRSIPKAKIVYAWQATSNNVARILKETDYSAIDAIACAPYLALFKGGNPDVSESTAGTVDELLRRAETHGIQWAVEAVERYKRQADELGVECWAYEFGSHLDEHPIVFEAHQDPRFQRIYEKYINAVFEAGITRGCLFTLVQKPNDRLNTSFGQMRFLGDTSSPRWLAIEALNKNGGRP